MTIFFQAWQGEHGGFGFMVCFLSESREHHVLRGGAVSIYFTSITGLPACSHYVAIGNTIIHLGISIDWI